MAGYLYAVKFSNGVIKVGRATDSGTRLAQHAARLSVGGIAVVATVTAPCVGSAFDAEAALIHRCADAASHIHGNEWFEGLDFGAVREWVRAAASEPRLPVQQGLTKRQTEVLLFVERFISTHGYPPTRRDVADHFGFSSQNAAEDHLQALSRKGAIFIRKNCARGISLAEPRKPSEHAIQAEEH